MSSESLRRDEWRYWGGDEHSTRYSPIDQITANNVADIEVAWRWKAANYGPTPDYIYRATPLYVDGRLFTVAGSRRAVVSIDPATGETLWVWRMKENPRWRASTRKSYGRGLAYAPVNGRGVVYVVTPGYYLVALDSETGLPINRFGINGVVDLHLGLGNYPVEADIGISNSGDITSSSPPIVVNGVVVVGSAHDHGYFLKRKENIPGHIRGYDAKTGEMLWRFHVIPGDSELGNDTWEGDSWRYTGNVSSWAPLSADSKRGLVYVPTDAPTNDYYGGDRLGDNLFANSLLALDVKTGKRVWHYQMVHHDIWNYDNPTAPKLLDIFISGKRVPIVAEATKQGMLFVFNRETGEPIWPIEERSVLRSSVPGESTSPTQPFVTRPEPFADIEFTEDDIIDFTPALRQAAMDKISRYHMGGVFTPPVLYDPKAGMEGTVFLPGVDGGANISGGSSVDPETGFIYIATVRDSYIIGLTPGRLSGANSKYITQAADALHVQGLPIFTPPWGEVVAIDLNRGEIAWRIPNGDTPRSVVMHPGLKGVQLPKTGKRSHATLLTTKTLLFFGEGRRGDPILHAVDKRSGNSVAEIDLPARSSAAPMTYLHEGRQYIVLAVAGPGHEAELVALTLPRAPLINSATQALR